MGTITIPAWVVSNEMLKRSYGFANDEVPNDAYPLRFRQFMANSLKLAESSNAYRVKYENVQRRCTMLPPMHDLRRILGRFLAVDPDSFDAPDEWSEDGIEW